ncbi:MAG: hypothetical protein IKG18_05110 [Atopobiaceae bacterium]|nr:hypothetical protein [Atopobiaceae bacterium]
MADTAKTIENLQVLVTELAQAADAHAIQSKVFAAQGFSKLAEKYVGHATEEREFVDRMVDRIIDLGGEPACEAKEAQPVISDAIEYIRHDADTNRGGIAWLHDVVEEAAGDYPTYDLLKEYYNDEVEDMNWGDAQLELIEKIGVANWYMTLL